MNIEQSVALVTGINRGIGRRPGASLASQPVIGGYSASKATICRHFHLLSLLSLSLLGAACGSNDNDTSDLSAKVAANGDQVTTLATDVDQNHTKLEGVMSKLRDLETASMNEGVDLEHVKDVAAVSAVAGCYGRGHDAVVPGKKADQGEALAILRTCFADDVQSEFRYFGSPAQPSDQLEDLPALVEYIGSFWANAGYHSARNVPGNVHVELRDARHATLLYSGTTPHFSVAQDDADPKPDVVSRPGFIDAISASYTSELDLGDDNVWRTTHFTIDIKEVIRVNGTYWIAQ
jgi:hypothetical protein